jgi:hypothetical protein
MRDEQKKTLIIFLVVGIAAGAVLTGIGFGKWRTSRQGSFTPQEMTVAELSSSGPPKNKHVRLRDCSPTENFAHLGLKDSANFNRVWQPLAVSGGGQGGARPRGVVVTSDEILDVKKMGPIRAREIDGLIVTDSYLLPDEARRMCASQDPSADYTDPIVIELNGYPSRAKVFGLFGGGIVLLLVAIGSVAGFFALRWVQAQRENAPRPTRRPGRRRRTDDFD